MCTPFPPFHTHMHAHMHISTINYEHTLRSASNATQRCCFCLMPSKWSKIWPAELQTNDAPPFLFKRDAMLTVLSPSCAAVTLPLLLRTQIWVTWRCEALAMQRATECSVVTGDQFWTWWQGRRVCRARYWSVISIADASFCRRPLQQTQGSSISAEWLNWNSCAWEILKRALLFSKEQSFWVQVCIEAVCLSSMVWWDTFSNII